MTNLKTTQIAAEALLSGTPALDVTQIGAEALVPGSPALRVTQIGAEILVEIEYAYWDMALVDGGVTID